VNMHSKPLHDTEIQLMKQNHDIQARLIRSYNLMLDFFGMRLKDIRLCFNNQGEITRSRYWQKRFKNIKQNPHNKLRITRILISLSLLGLEHFVQPFIDFLKHEIFVTRQLACCEQSYLQHWLPVRNGLQMTQ